MALLAPREVMPEYQPVPVPPPDGLLAAAVGTPQAPQPPIDPNVYESDDVVGQLNSITAADSGYMQLARTSGLQTANKRGLLNTSLATGASQAAAIAAAAPLASQNAAQAAQRNQTRLGAFFTGKQQEADIASREKMLQEQLASEEARLGRQLTSQEQMQIRDISSRMEMQGIDLATQREMQQQQITATQRITEANIAAESERLGRQLTAQETSQIRDLAAQQARLESQLAMQEELTRLGYETDITRTNLTEAGANLRANLDAATRTQLAELDALSGNQRAALQYYLGQDQIYAQSVSNLYENKDIPAPLRDAAIQQFLALKNSGINLPALLFGLDIAWGSPTPTTTTTAPTTTTTTPTTGTVSGGGGGSLLNMIQNL